MERFPARLSESDLLRALDERRACETVRALAKELGHHWASDGIMYDARARSRVAPQISDRDAPLPASALDRGLHAADDTLRARLVVELRHGSESDRPCPMVFTDDADGESAVPQMHGSLDLPP